MSNAPIPPSMPPMPPQLPLQPLSYSQAQGVGRPGILTAVAVVSIVMAILSFLGALGAGFQTAFFVIMPSLAKNLPTAPGAGPTTAPTNPFANLTIDPVQLALGLTDAVLRLALSILLAIAAVSVLRDVRSGRSLHLIWAYLRIPVALLGAAAHFMLMQSFMTSMTAAMPATPGTPPPAMPTSFANAMGSAVDLGMAVAYPIGVLIVMHTKRVKDFYQTLGK